MTPNATHRLISSLLGISLLIIGGLVWHLDLGCSGDGRESFGDKREWSILQSLEATHRDTAISGIEFTQYEDYRIISLPSVTGERLWIMLNPKNAPYYKQMGHGNYDLSEDQYWQIVRTWNPISTVDECLKSHMRRSK